MSRLRADFREKRVSTSSLWFLCREHRGHLITRLELIQDGRIVGGGINEQSWQIVDNKLQILGKEAQVRFIFELKQGRGHELRGMFYPVENDLPTTEHILRPLGPAVPSQAGPLPIQTSSMAEALKLMSEQTDFSLILAPGRYVRSQAQSLSLDDCRIDIPQAAEFFLQGYHAAPVFLNILHEADLVCGSVVVRRDGIVMAETTSFVQNRTANLDYALSADSTRAYLPDVPNIPVRWPGTGFLLNTVNSNYGHWHLQSAVNADAYHSIKAALQEEIYVLSLDGLGSEHFRPAAHAALGLSPEKVISTPRFPSLIREKFERLIVPSALAVSPGVAFHPHLVKSLERLKRPRTIDGARRLYLSRKDVSNSRGIINTEELFQALQTLGFVEIVTSEMSYEEELQAFSDADVVVAPHGGGLTNMIAREPGLKVFELLHSKLLNGWYKNLSAISGHEYAAYCVEPLPEEASKGWHASFKVDVGKVVASLTKFIDT